MNDTFQASASIMDSQKTARQVSLHGNSLFPRDGFLAHSGYRHIDSVPFLKPLTSLNQDRQEACSYPIPLFRNVTEKWLLRLASIKLWIVYFLVTKAVT